MYSMIKRFTLPVKAVNDREDLIVVVQEIEYENDHIDGETQRTGPVW